MKKNVLKTVSIVVAVSVITVLFACLSGVGVYAVNAAKMIHVDNANIGYISYQWRPSQYDNVIKPSTKYRISFYWENISNASLSTNLMFYAKYYSNSWNTLFKTSDLSQGAATNKAIYKTNLMHGQKIDFDFTTPSDCRDGGSICFLFGDWDWQYSGVSMKFNLAEIKIYTRDNNENLTEVPITDICANETLGTCTNSTPTSTRGQVMRNTTRGTGAEISFQNIPDGYFDPLPVDTDIQNFKDSHGAADTNVASLAAKNMLAKPQTGTVYYVDADYGSDNNNGTSPQTAWKTLTKVNTAALVSGDMVLFKRGCVWRMPKGNTHALFCKQGVIYGAYGGSGSKPIIDCSVYNYKNRTWTEDSPGIWKTIIKHNDITVSADSVGIIVYNYGSKVGNMVLSKDDLATAQDGDFFNQTPNGADGGDGYVYVKCNQNPSNRYSSIEIGQKRFGIELKTDVTLNNICVKYGGAHGIHGGSLVNVAISYCDVYYIGGSYSNNVRYGNGIEFGQGARNCRVKDCHIKECYDAGLTFQNWSGSTNKIESIGFSGNLIENCNYGIEWFAPTETEINGVYISHNIICNSGYGWGYDERIGYGQNIGVLQTSALRAGENCNYSDITDMYIFNNTFYRSNGSLIYWKWTNFPCEDELHIYNNNYYQSLTETLQPGCDDKHIALTFRDTTKYAYNDQYLTNAVAYVEGNNPTGFIKYLKDY